MSQRQSLLTMFAMHCKDACTVHVPTDGSVYVACLQLDMPKRHWLGKIAQAATNICSLRGLVAMAKWRGAKASAGSRGCIYALGHVRLGSMLLVLFMSGENESLFVPDSVDFCFDPPQSLFPAQDTSSRSDAVLLFSTTDCSNTLNSMVYRGCRLPLRAAPEA